MKLISALSIAISSILANKLRSALTMLGIIIGVGAVITLMAIGQGTQNSVLSSFSSLGTNLLEVVPSSPEVSGFAGISPQFATPSLTLDDGKSLEHIPDIVAIAPINENFVDMSYGGESKTAVLYGTTPEFVQTMNFTVASGQFINNSQVASKDQVVVLGSEIATALFGNSDPVGQRVKLKGERYTVIGVFAPKGGAVIGISMNAITVVPITTFQSRLFVQKTPNGDDAVQAIEISVDKQENQAAVTTEIQSILRKRHHISADKKDDFSVVSQQQLAGLVSQVTSVFSIFLGAIASISLLVGGIGIMNIMLVSVTERTREIGIRKAIGAKRRDILLQFLIEAGMLSFLGGAIGITGGILISLAISQINVGGFQIQAQVAPSVVILAVSVSIIIGLASGIYPAMRAARLNPIEALRHD